MPSSAERLEELARDLNRAIDIPPFPRGKQYVSIGGRIVERLKLVEIAAALRELAEIKRKEQTDAE